METAIRPKPNGVLSSFRVVVMLLRELADTDSAKFSRQAMALVLQAAGLAEGEKCRS